MMTFNMFNLFGTKPEYKAPEVQPIKVPKSADDKPVYSVGITSDGRVTLTVSGYTTLTMGTDACAKLISMLATAMEDLETDNNEEENAE